jgi:hypothetical protein
MIFQGLEEVVRLLPGNAVVEELIHPSSQQIDGAFSFVGR